MKYWIYKDSRILGPFDKQAFGDLPGLDASTLVCEGESPDGGGDWRPAGEIADLSALPLEHGLPWPSSDVPSALGPFETWELETFSLLADESYPETAETLFQDADVKRSMADLLTPRPSVDEAELKRAKDRVVELTTHLELLYKRVAELESGQTSLVHRLAEKELLLRRQPPPPPPPTLKALLRGVPPAPPPPPVPPEPIVVPPETFASTSAVPPAAPAAPASGSFTPAPPPAPPEPPVPILPPPSVVLPAASAPLAHPLESAAPPDLPALTPAPPPPATPAPAMPPAAAEAPAPRTMFEKRAFKPARAVKSFRVVGGEEPAAATPAAPPEAPAPAAEALPAGPIPAAPAMEIASPPMPKLQPLAPEASEPVFPPIAPAPASAPAPAPASAPAPVPFDWSAAASVPAAAPPAPPATLKIGRPALEEPVLTPMPAFTGGDAAAFSDAAVVAESATQQVLARLAKPEMPAPTAAPPRRPRNNKPFLIAGAALVVLLAALGFFLKQPKDLKQMASLDDGRSRVGAEPVDDAARAPAASAPASTAAPEQAPAATSAASPAVAPSAPVADEASTSPAVPAPAPTEAPQAASQADLQRAIQLTQEYPLEGDRGNVARWLQYSYLATPDAGQENWSASQTGDKTYLVEYRFTTPNHQGDVTYMFEADVQKELVRGKTMNAAQMLAGGAPAADQTEKPRAKAKPRAAVKKPAPRRKTAAVRAAKAKAAAAPKDVPLLPLPDDGELKPPAEDDGAFRSETGHSDL